MLPRRRSRSILLISIMLVAAQIACQAAKPSTPAPPETVQPAAIALPAETAASQSAETAPVEATPTSVLLSHAVQDGSNGVDRPAVDGIACLATADSGVICLESAGWAPYSQENAALPTNYITTVTVCQDGTLLAAHPSGVSAFDGQAWKTHELNGYSSPDVVACDGQGGFWAGHFQGVSHFDGQAWTDYPSSELASGAAANELVEDLLVAPDGTVWVATANSLAAFDGEAWRVFQAGQGFDETYYFDQLALDGQGGVWAAHSSGILRYDAGQWSSIPNPDLVSVSALAIDLQGRPWVGTVSGGLTFLDEGVWTTFRQETGGLSSDSIQSLAIDGRGRVWAGTRYGLSVLDGGSWQTYRMDNSGLGDNDIRALAVQAGGPDLPVTVGTAPGSLSGRIVLADGQPLVSAPVEICVESLGTMYFGDTPCDGQPFLQGTTTDGDGKFSLADLPAGFYLITVNTGGSWAVLQTDLGITSERVRVAPGEDTDVGELRLEPDA